MPQGKPTLPVLNSPSPLLQELLAMGMPRFSADGSALMRPDGSVFAQVCLLPVFSVLGGTYGPSQSIELSTLTVEGAIVFTIDGTNPTPLSDVYAAPIAVEGDLEIRAMVIADGLLSSPVVGQTYIIENGTLPTPTIDPDGGPVVADVDPITLACAEPTAAIYYTLDDSEPDDTSTLYVEPFTIAAGCTVKCIAILADWSNSLVASADFTIA